jgi:hypothetical protein
MRTTLSIDDDIVPELKRYAESRSIGLGRAVSELLRREFSEPMRIRMVNGLPVVCLPPDSPRVTTELVKRLQDEE